METDIQQPVGWSLSLGWKKLLQHTELLTNSIYSSVLCADSDNEHVRV